MLPAHSTGARARLAWEWVWRTRALETARRTFAQTARARELWRRSRLAAELAERALEPDTPLADGPGHALAVSLYREAAFWALSARQPAGSAEGRSLEELLSMDAQSLRIAGFSDPESARVRLVLAEQTFVAGAELDRSTQIADAELARRFVESVLQESGTASEPGRAVAGVLRERAIRSLAVLLVLAALAVCCWLAIQRAIRGPDLALGKSWSVSKKWADCHPEWRKCGNARTRVFFHTKHQKQPWFLVDLGPGTTVGRLEVENRDDCCQERALPLVVEVSDDKQGFREIARRTEPFDTWVATFDPLQTRFVRLRVDGRSYLHLSRVSVRRR